MEFKIDLTSDIAAAKEQTIRELKERIRRSSSKVASELMQDGGTWGKSSGVIYDIIKRKVEDYCISDEFSALMDRLIEQEAETHARMALTTLLNSRSRKMLFTAVPVPEQK